ncbi:2,3-diketo-5-methylthio-1-phosphopentane phosphatase [Cladophialophora yegresii CBS 114405]|uniref:2,3-diketo-5-methylthio-1-phosphopentane phosphatase n=1 Tax=Cladophialophora yegresii CBS 114405 TaxID=1182544 RepID=W9WBL2_9EURO|nr:2,3-diketo-5-methylthio-1-phosphopentane phosphatase [Cladophialophora yegresii CBS 114405]EXJ65507.1 2,3-diketo-5-methylthio-1-phosphopentane phosphatase [Cladophialophora yegresii CBS 114405]
MVASEGTICPISWVKETLFPYALKALPKVLATKWDDEGFKGYRDKFPETARSSRALFEAHVKDLTARDVKVAYLKDLQGYLWEEGYRSRAYSTPVYADVLAWMDGLASSPATAIAIYSSGSIFAQKLLFQHIKDPARPEDLEAVVDRRDMVTAWFDTTNAGPKHESSSYAKIASELQREPEEILFLSDNVKEVRAARDANFHAVVVDRPGNAPLSNADREELQVVESFGQLELR